MYLPQWTQTAAVRGSSIKSTFWLNNEPFPFWATALISTNRFTEYLQCLSARTTSAHWCKTSSVTLGRALQDFSPPKSWVCVPGRRLCYSEGSVLWLDSAEWCIGTASGQDTSHWHNNRSLINVSAWSKKNHWGKKIYYHHCYLCLLSQFSLSLSHLYQLCYNNGACLQLTDTKLFM